MSFRGQHRDANEQRRIDEEMEKIRLKSERKERVNKWVEDNLYELMDKVAHQGFLSQANKSNLQILLQFHGLQLLSALEERLRKGTNDIEQELSYIHHALTDGEMNTTIISDIDVNIKNRGK